LYIGSASILAPRALACAPFARILRHLLQRRGQFFPDGGGRDDLCRRPHQLFQHGRVQMNLMNVGDQDQVRRRQLIVQGRVPSRIDIDRLAAPAHDEARMPRRRNALHGPQIDHQRAQVRPERRFPLQPGGGGTLKRLAQHGQTPPCSATRVTSGMIFGISIRS
jgi:hypothetical protein